MNFFDTHDTPNTNLMINYTHDFVEKKNISNVFYTQLKCYTYHYIGL